MSRSQPTGKFPINQYKFSRPTDQSKSKRRCERRPNGFYVYSIHENVKTGEIIVEGGGIDINFETLRNILRDPVKYADVLEGTLALLGELPLQPDQAKTIMEDLETYLFDGPHDADAREAYDALKDKHFSGHKTMVHADVLSVPRVSEDRDSAMGSIDGKEELYINEDALTILEGENHAQIRRLIPTIKRDLDIINKMTAGLEQRFKAAIERIIAHPELSDIRPTSEDILEDFERQQAAAATDSRMTQPAIPPLQTPERIETETDALVVLSDTSIAIPSKVSEDSPINNAYKFLIGQTVFSSREALLAVSARFKNSPIHNLHVRLAAVIAGTTGGEGLTLELIEALENKDVDGYTKKIIAASISQGKIPFENDEQISRAITALSPEKYGQAAVKWLTTERAKLSPASAPTPGEDASLTEKLDKAFKEYIDGEAPPPAAAEAPQRANTLRGLGEAEPPKPAEVAAPPAEPQIVADLQRRLQAANSQIQRLSQTRGSAAELKRLREALTAQTAAAESFAARENQAVSEAQALRSQLADALRYKDIADAFESDKKALEEKLAEAPSQASVEPLRREAETLGTRLDGIISRLGKAEEQKKTLASDRQEREGDIEELQQSTAGVTEHYQNEIEEEEGDFKEQYSRLVSRIDARIFELREKTAEKELSPAERSRLAALDQRRERMIQRFKKEHLERVAEIQSDQEKELQVIKSEIEMLQEEVTGISSSLEETETRIAQALGEKSEIRQGAEKLQPEIERLQKELDGINGLVAQIIERASDEKKA